MRVSDLSDDDLRHIFNALDVQENSQVVRQASITVKIASATENAEKIRKYLVRTNGWEAVTSSLLNAAAHEDAVAAMCNLAKEEEMRQALLEEEAVHCCLNWLYEGRGERHAEYTVMLLVNLTQVEEGAEQLAKSKFWSLLLDRGRDPPAKGEHDPYAHVGSILANCAREAAVRRGLLNQPGGLPALVAAQLQSHQFVRRSGWATVFRNVLIKAEDDGLLDKVLADEASCRKILERLCGGDGVERDSEGIVRAALAAAVFLLVGSDANCQPENSWLLQPVLSDMRGIMQAQSDEGMDLLYKIEAPQKLMKAYEDEDDADAEEAMEETAALFLHA